MSIYSNHFIKKINNIFNPYRGLSREIYVLAAARVINAAGTFIFPLLTLILTRKVGMDESYAGLLISVSGLLFTLSGIIGGKLTDCLGRKNIIILFNSIGASCYLVAAFMGNSMKVVPFIMLAGFFMGMADPASNALIADVTTPGNRDSAYSLFYMAANLGFAISPIIGGLLFEKYLVVLFITDAATAFIAMILIFIYIPETISKVNEDFGKGRMLEARVEGSIFSVLKERPVLIFYALVMFGYNFVYSQWSFLYPIHAESIIPGNGAKFYGMLVSFNAFIVITLTPAITKLLSGKNSLRRIIYGGALYAIGFGLPGFLNKIPYMFISTFVLTLGEIVVTISSMPFIANHTPASHRGRMNAILPIIIGFGHTIGPLAMGRALTIMSIESGWKSIGLIMITYTIFAAMLEKYDKKTSNERGRTFSF